MVEPILRKRLDQHLAQLPVLPSVLMALMSLDKQNEEYFDQVLKLVESEPNFSTRILAVANSAGLGSRVPITTLRAAISRTGSRQATGLILGLSVARVFVPTDDWEKSLWRHAIQVATASRELAIRCREMAANPEEAYAAGLLHDVGRFVMFREAPEQLRRVDEGDWSDPEGLLATEMAICGITHADLGARACTAWGIPELITEVVRHHHDAEFSGLPLELARLVTIVHVADIAMFPSAMPGSSGLDLLDDATLTRQVLQRLPALIHLSLTELRELLLTATSEAAATTRGLLLG